MILNICLGAVLVVALLALVTAVGTVAIERQHPPAGRFVDVDGGRLHVLELGAQNDGVPIVLLHGASGNLHDMRLSLGERLARRHRVILIDRPGHGWSERPGGDEDASPSRQAALIAQALDASRRQARDRDRAFVRGRDRDGVRAGVSGARRRARSARAGDASVAGRHRVVLHARIDAGDRPAVRPHDRAPHGVSVAANAGARSVFAPQPMPEDYVRRSALALLLRPSAFRGECARRRAAEGERDAPVAALWRDRGADRHHHRRPRHDRVAGHPLARTRRDAAARQADRAARRRSRGPARRGRSGGCRDRTPGAGRRAE